MKYFAGPTVIPHPSTNLEYWEDWLGGTAAGQNGWSQAVLGTSYTTGTVVPTANVQGACTIQKGTAATGYAILHNTNVPIQVGGGSMTWEAKGGPRQLATVSEDFDVELGLGDRLSSTVHVDGITFRYSRATSANWLVRTTSNSISTTTTTSVPVATGYTRLRFEVNDVGTRVDFYINNVLVATHETNVPTGVARGMGFNNRIIGFVGTSIRNLDIDYISLKQTFTTAR